MNLQSKIIFIINCIFETLNIHVVIDFINHCIKKYELVIKKMDS
jgi:hypothetical protein